MERKMYTFFRTYLQRKSFLQYFDPQMLRAHICFYECRQPFSIKLKLLNVERSLVEFTSTSTDSPEIGPSAICCFDTSTEIAFRLKKKICEIGKWKLVYHNNLTFL